MTDSSLTVETSSLSERISRASLRTLKLTIDEKINRPESRVADKGNHCATRSTIYQSVTWRAKRIKQKGTGWHADSGTTPLETRPSAALSLTSYNGR
jgi:hypothetical protein